MKIFRHIVIVLRSAGDRRADISTKHNPEATPQKSVASGLPAFCNCVHPIKIYSRGNVSCLACENLIASTRRAA